MVLLDLLVLLVLQAPLVLLDLLVLLVPSVLYLHHHLLVLLVLPAQVHPVKNLPLALQVLVLNHLWNPQVLVLNLHYHQLFLLNLGHHLFLVVQSVNYLVVLMDP